MAAAPLRIGVLGAARIVPNALLKPARVVEGVVVDAVAARDVNRANAFARRHGIPRVLDSYEALVNDPALDAIYNPLPNSLHGEWSIRALAAGKHVLCEKPLASNAAEAERMARTADENGRVLMEAFHFRYHPLMQRVLQLVAEGEIGALREVSAEFFIPLFLRPHDIRFELALAGGALMDTGCYCVNFLRAVGGEPTVHWAQAVESSPQVDRVMRAALEFPSTAAGILACSLAAFPPLKIKGAIRGEGGAISVTNPFLPHVFNSIRIETPAGVRRERVTREPTYNFQLRAFRDAVYGKPTNLTDGWEGVKNMQVIDAVYAAAGMKPRAS